MTKSKRPPPQDGGFVTDCETELDAQMAEVADFFTGRFAGETDVVCRGALDRSALDYSLPSLRAVNRWLVALSAELAGNDDLPGETVMWAGAYVGEVIRRSADQPYHWVRWVDYMATQAEGLRSVLPETFGTQFLLVADDGAMTMPINKVCRFLDEGPENDLHFYAAAEVHRKRSERG